MAENKFEHDGADDQRALNRLLKNTIGHGFDSDHLGFVEGDKWAGKVLEEIFRQPHLAGSFSPSSSPAASPRMRTKPGNVKLWAQPGAVTAIPLTGSNPVDESDDESMSESATPRDSDNEEEGLADKPKKKWFGSLKSRAVRKKNLHPGCQESTRRLKQMAILMTKVGNTARLHNQNPIPKVARKPKKATGYHALVCEIHAKKSHR